MAESWNLMYHDPSDCYFYEWNGRAVDFGGEDVVCVDECPEHRARAAAMGVKPPAWGDLTVFFTP